MSINIGVFPAVDLLQQVLDMPHGGKGGGGHRPSSGFTELVDAQLAVQAAASASAVAPRQRITNLALQPKNDEGKDRRQHEESEAEAEAEEQAQRQSSGRSLWA